MTFTRLSAAGVSLLIALAGLTGCAVSHDSAPGAAANGPLTSSEHAALEIRTVAACMDEQGWNVQVTSDGGMGADLPSDQAAAYQSANQQCRSDFLAAHPRPALDDESELVTLYEHQLVLVDCLAAKGYPPVQQPPSEREYVAEGLTGRTPEFSAWSAVASPPADELAELQRDCPLDPSGA